MRCIVDAMDNVYCNRTWPTEHTKSRLTTGSNHFTYQLRCFSLFSHVPTNISASIHNFDDDDTYGHVPEREVSGSSL